MTKPVLLHTTITTLVLISSLTRAFSSTFTLTNQCTYPIWTGLLSGAGTAPLPTTGFPLQPSQSNAVEIPPGWSGRIWGRTLCSTDATGRFSCVTGDCGSGTVECNGAGAAPPTTLAEFTLNGANGMDFYDVSLVDGYNLPMTVLPQGGTQGRSQEQILPGVPGTHGTPPGSIPGGTGGCNITGCFTDLNLNCPSELRLTGASDGGGSVACRSACEAFRDPKYCCSGAYSTPQTCSPSSYSQYFKTACPTAYSYAYDDGTSTFTCSNANYVITFCPTPANSRKTTGLDQSTQDNGSGSLAKDFNLVIAFILMIVLRL